MLTSLHKKLLRDIWHMRAQVFAIALVILSGVAVYIMSLSTLHSLQQTRTLYYQSQNFADIFVNLKRAPLHVVNRITAIDSVKHVDPRIVSAVNIDVADFGDPIQGKLISLPENEHHMLNQPFLNKGRLPSAYREQEIIVSDAFAKAHHLNLQDTISMVINGKKRDFLIVGTALSPEYIYQIAPGAIFPDYKRYAIVWMGQRAFEQAYDMDGAFNDLSISVLAGANQQKVIEAVDEILKPYGGLGANTRKDQLSHKFLQEEFKQLHNMAVMFPIIFFSVAGFLLYMVMIRLIQTEREQIAILKAFGYTNFQVSWLYIKMVILIVTIGIILGIGVGAWMGKGLSGIYMDFYKFPYLIYHLSISVVCSATLICLAVAIAGALLAVKEAYSLTPAEGMLPAPPGVYKHLLVEKLFTGFNYATRMVARGILRRPLRAFMTMFGIACAGGILMIGSFQKGAIDHMMDIHFSVNQQEDIFISFNEPASIKALYSLNSLDGVRMVEPMRSVPTRLVFEHREYITSLTALSEDQQLRKIVDINLTPLSITTDGIVLSEYFKTLLGVEVGDWITLEILEGKKHITQNQVIGFVQEYMGLGAYISRDSIYKLLQEAPNMNGALLKIEPTKRDSIYRNLKEMPIISGITFRENAIKNFYDTFAETILVFSFFISIFGATLAFGLIFNNAIISLAEKNRELATFRVMGFTKLEVANILLGELIILTLLAIPFGFAMGAFLCKVLSVTLQSELYRVPLILEKYAFSYSCAVVLLASFCACLFLFKRIKELDMIATLKAKE